MHFGFLSNELRGKSLLIIEFPNFVVGRNCQIYHSSFCICSFCWIIWYCLNFVANTTFFLAYTKLETLNLMYSVISRNGSCLHVLDRTSKPNIVRPRPKEPFGLGAKAERPKLMRCISKTKKASRKAPCWLKKQTFFLSLSLLLWWIGLPTAKILPKT